MCLRIKSVAQLVNTMRSVDLNHEDVEEPVWRVSVSQRGVVQERATRREITLRLY